MAQDNNTRPSEGEVPTGLDGYRKLIIENLKFIEERCYKAYGLYGAYRSGEDVSGANKADSLLVAVMEHLSADDYRVIREYKGKSSLKRYLEVVISNKVVDLYRSKEGRSRAAEEAGKMGEVGVRLYELVFIKGMPVPEAHGILKSESGFTGGLEVLEGMAEKIGSKRVSAHREVLSGTALMDCDETTDGKGGSHRGLLKDESGQITVADDGPDPESAYIEKERQTRKADALRDVVQSLAPEERLMVRLKYVDGKGIREIARAIGSTEKNTYRKLGAMLLRCRKMLFKKGLKTEDLL